MFTLYIIIISGNFHLFFKGRVRGDHDPHPNPFVLSMGGILVFNFLKFVTL